MTLAAEMAADWWAQRLAQGDRAAFKAALLPLIETKLAEYGSCFLQCDYDPQGPLLEAVRAIGIECRGCMGSAKDILPMKHSLRVTPNMLEPKEGYGRWTDPIVVGILHLGRCDT